MSVSEDARKHLPVLPLRDMVVYPHGVHPLFVGTKSSIAALDAAMAADKRIVLVAKRDAALENPGADDLFAVGTLSAILQLLKLPDGTVKVLVEGNQRARIERLADNGSHWVADVEVASDGRHPEGPRHGAGSQHAREARETREAREACSGR